MNQWLLNKICRQQEYIYQFHYIYLSSDVVHALHRLTGNSYISRLLDMVLYCLFEVTMECEICNRSGKSFFLVTHKEKGKIRICSDCLQKERDNLCAQKSCSCCWGDRRLMSCISKEAVDRMTRLIGDRDKAECKVNRLRTLTMDLDEEELKTESEIFQAMADPCRLKILSLLRQKLWFLC